jgi:hypothetical protein
MSPPSLLTPANKASTWTRGPLGLHGAQPQPVDGGRACADLGGLVIVSQPNGTTTKIWPVTVGGQKLFAFQSQTGPKPLSWTAYDNSGHVVRWPAG